MHSATPGRTTQLTVAAAIEANLKPGTTLGSTMKLKGKIIRITHAIARAGKAPAKYTRHPVHCALREKYAPAAPTNGRSINHGTYTITLHGGP
jgi:hypothetical protein